MPAPGDGRYVLTNFVGEYAVLERRTLDDFARHRLATDSQAYRDLKSRHFLLDADSEVAIDLLAAKYPHTKGLSGRLDQPVYVCNHAALRSSL